MLDQFRSVDPGRTGRFALRSLGGLSALVVAGAAFAVLLAAVALSWPPLVALDIAIADRLNDVVSERRIVVGVLRTLSELGGSPTSWVLLSTATVWLLIRRRPGLAVYVVVTGLGAAILDPTIKLLVGRARPVVETMVATAPGNSFPSGHALGSTVMYGVLLLVFLPAVPPRARRPLGLATAAVLALVGFTRLALGVHYLTDVLGGWLLGSAWLGTTAVAFRHWREERGLPRGLLSEGLEPEAAPALEPAPDAGTERLPDLRQAAASLVVVWVLLLGVLIATGLLVTEVLPGTALDRLDEEILREAVDLRSPTRNTLSRFASLLGGTPFVVGSAIVVAALALAVSRRWKPLLFLATTMIGEVALFLTVGQIVGRPRPDVPQLDPNLPPTSSFPSGHVSAAISWYGALALLTLAATHGRRRWLVGAAFVLVVLLVAGSRIYRGVHHPSDLLGSLLLALPWLATTWLTLRPSRTANGSRLGAVGRPVPVRPAGEHLGDC